MDRHFEAIDKRERVFVLAVGLGVLAVTSLPALYGYLSAPADRVFSGIVFNVPDVSHNFAWMRHFRESILIQNWMTPEESAPVFFNLLWWAWGHISGWMGWSYGLGYQVLRLVAGVSLLALLHPFLALFLARRRERMLAYLLVVIASGLGGWFVFAIKLLARIGISTTLGLHPLDLFVAESNTFFGMMVSPHFIIAAALMLAIFQLFVLGYERQKIRYTVGAGFVGLVLGLQHAYDLLLIYAVMGFFLTLVSLRGGFRWRAWLNWVLIGLLSCPGGLYSVIITQRDPIWKAVLAQFVNAGVFTPDPWHLFILLGLPLVIAVLTFDGLVPLTEYGERELFVKSWFIVGGLLIYVPTSFQIHYLNGWQIPVAILAARAFVGRVLPRLGLCRDAAACQGWRGVLWRVALPGALLLAVCGTNIYLTGWSVHVLSRHEAPHYLTQGDSEAMSWLDEHTQSQEVILSSLHTGHHIPSRAGNKPFIAHWAATVDFLAKRDAVRRFYDVSTSDAEREILLRDYGVRYVYHGSNERALGSYEPAHASYLEPLFASTGVAIYAVRPKPELTSTRPSTDR